MEKPLKNKIKDFNWVENEINSPIRFSNGDKIKVINIGDVEDLIDFLGTYGKTYRTGKFGSNIEGEVVEVMNNEFLFGLREKKTKQLLFFPWLDKMDHYTEFYPNLNVKYEFIDDDLNESSDLDWMKGPPSFRFGEISRDLRNYFSKGDKVYLTGILHLSEGNEDITLHLNNEPAVVKLVRVNSGVLDLILGENITSLPIWLSAMSDSDLDLGNFNEDDDIIITIPSKNINESDDLDWIKDIEPPNFDFNFDGKEHWVDVSNIDREGRKKIVNHIKKTVPNYEEFESDLFGSISRGNYKGIIIHCGSDRTYFEPEENLLCSAESSYEDDYKLNNPYSDMIKSVYHDGQQILDYITMDGDGDEELDESLEWSDKDVPFDEKDKSFESDPSWKDDEDWSLNPERSYWKQGDAGGSGGGDVNESEEDPFKWVKDVEPDELSASPDVFFRSDDEMYYTLDQLGHDITNMDVDTMCELAQNYGYRWSDKHEGWYHRDEVSDFKRGLNESDDLNWIKDVPNTVPAREHRRTIPLKDLLVDIMKSDVDLLHHLVAEDHLVPTQEYMQTGNGGEGFTPEDWDDFGYDEWANEGDWVDNHRWIEDPQIRQHEIRESMELTDGVWKMVEWDTVEYDLEIGTHHDRMVFKRKSDGTYFALDFAGNPNDGIEDWDEELYQVFPKQITRFIYESNKKIMFEGDMNESNELEWISNTRPTLKDVFDENLIEVGDILTLYGTLEDGDGLREQQVDDFKVKIESVSHKGELSSTYFTPLQKKYWDFLGYDGTGDVRFVKKDGDLQLVGRINSKDVVEESNDLDWIKGIKPKGFEKSKSYVVDVSHLKPYTPISVSPTSEEYTKLTRADVLDKFKELGYNVDEVSIDDADYLYIEPNDKAGYWDDDVWVDQTHWLDYNMKHNTPDPTYDGKYEIIDINDLMFLLDNKFISESNEWSWVEDIPGTKEFGQKYRYFEIVACYNIDYESEECEDEYSHYVRIPKYEADEIWDHWVDYFAGIADGDGEGVIRYAIKNRLISHFEINEIIMFEGVRELDKNTYDRLTDYRDTKMDESNDFDWVKDVKPNWGTYYGGIIMKDIEGLPKNLEDVTSEMLLPIWMKIETINRQILTRKNRDAEHDVSETLFESMGQIEWLFGRIMALVDGETDSLVSSRMEPQEYYNSRKLSIINHIKGMTQQLELLGESNDFDWAKDIKPNRRDSKYYIIDERSSNTLKDGEWFIIEILDRDNHSVKWRSYAWNVVKSHGIHSTIRSRNFPHLLVPP
jgi:hypothetical protein